MKEVLERLEIATEQVNQVRRSVEGEGLGYRLDIALQALKSATALLKQSGTSLNAQSLTETASPDTGFPIKVVWNRPRKNQRFEGQLLRDGRIRLPDGRGIFAPSGACSALVEGFFNGWREWKYWDEEEQKWLPINELRIAGWIE